MMMILCARVCVCKLVPIAFPLAQTVERWCFQGHGIKARTDKIVNVYLEMQCKSLLIKASAKCQCYKLPHNYNVNLLIPLPALF